MDRRSLALKHIDKAGRGVEIGPSYSPLAPKREGFQVHIIDHLNREQLIAKYGAQNVDVSNIEEVDFVWTGQSFAELTGKSNYYDWIIASHVIEHSPDLIGFLNDCDTLLNDRGVLSLVIPDKRYCFDHYRPNTGLARIIDVHDRQDRIHSPGSVAEHHLNAIIQNGSSAWRSGAIGPRHFVHTLAEARTIMQSVAENESYLDVHAWCFTPHSFRLMISDLHALGLIRLREVDFSTTVNYEFFINLSRSGSDVNSSRMALLNEVAKELSARGTIWTWTRAKAGNLLRRFKRGLGTSFAGPRPGR